MMEALNSALFIHGDIRTVTFPSIIHFEVFSNYGNALLITELLFDDHKCLTPSMCQHMARKGAFIAINKATTGEQLYNYDIVTGQ